MGRAGRAGARQAGSRPAGRQRVTGPASARHPGGSGSAVDLFFNAEIF